ncbi:CinA family protein [Leucobacter denitrificans]|uniref:CinA family protein n=1 Tax=Leucobacter denitrificans TaxID=683042 RepID=A0A7G9S7G1_9MICO|nr:CinA family protein [Leucobacter denitrificans]
MSRLAEQAVALATKLGIRIAVAESLTGGLVAATLVAIPGASKVLSGGIVAYDTSLKTTLLGVDRDLLQKTGPVDSAVATQMAVGVRDACAVETPDGRRSADLGISTTGVAGPDPDPQTGQSAGTVWIGVSSRLGERSKLLPQVLGDRQSVRDAVVSAVILLLVEELTEIAVDCA